MMWIYTCWIIVLAGMEIIWHLQNKATAAIRPITGSDGDDSRQMQAQQDLPHD
jgi:uncharacterized BrkB/YihY/UPF0761 family membrane protein